MDNAPVIPENVDPWSMEGLQILFDFTTENGPHSVKFAIDRAERQYPWHADLEAVRYVKKVFLDAPGLSQAEALLKAGRGDEFVVLWPTLEFGENPERDRNYLAVCAAYWLSDSAFDQYEQLHSCPTQIQICQDTGDYEYDDVYYHTDTDSPRAMRGTWLRERPF